MSGSKILEYLKVLQVSLKGLHLLFTSKKMQNRKTPQTPKTPNITNIRTLQKIFNEINNLQAPLMFCIVLTTLFSRTFGTKVIQIKCSRGEFPEHCVGYLVEMTVPPEDTLTVREFVDLALGILFLEHCTLSVWCKVGMRVSGCPGRCLG